MHETKFVNEILAVLKEKIGNDIKTERILVNVRLSPFSHVSAEALTETFNMLVMAQYYKKASINVRPLEIPFECGSCKRSGTITKKMFECPFCGSLDINVHMDKEFFVESIEIER